MPLKGAAGLLLARGLIKDAHTHGDSKGNDLRPDHDMTEGLRSWICVNCPPVDPLDVASEATGHVMYECVSL